MSSLSSSSSNSPTNSQQLDKLLCDLRAAIDPGVLAQVDQVLSNPVLPPLPASGEVRRVAESESVRRLAAAAELPIPVDASESLAGQIGEAIGDRAVAAADSANADAYSISNIVILAHIFRDPGVASKFPGLVDAILDPERALRDLDAK